jgi:signal transduction histidine kinase/ActR/RegA family two-component response regulator
MKNIWNLGIKLKIGLGFALILIIMVSVQYGLNKSINNVITSQEELLTSTKLSTEIEAIKSSVIYFESKMKGYVLTSNDTLLENNEKYLNDIVRKFRGLQKLSPNAEQKNAIDTLVRLLNKQIQFTDEVIFQHTLDPKNAVLLIRSSSGKKLMSTIITKLEKINAIEEKKFKEILAKNKEYSRSVKLMDTSAYVFAFLLVATFIWFLYTDINKRQKLEEALIIAQKKAEEAAIVKEQFMANMSHEIRTPMNAIIGFNNRLMKTNLTPEQKDYVVAVQSSGENLLTIVNDVLDFSKIEAGMVKLENISFNLPDLLRSVHNMFLMQAKEKRINLQVSVSKNVPELVIGDPTRLTQILLNLVGNALKFTDKGHVTILAETVNQNEEHSYLQFKIKDTGIGIATDKISEIFNRFTQEKSDTNRIYGGTGLGLSIVKKLLELQNGTIMVDSEKDKGSTFTFILPFCRIKKLHADTKINPEKTTEPFIKNKIKILVVEDNIMNQKLAGFMLNDWGFDHDICGNGKLAIEKIKTNSYDLILMDIQMPEINGYETTKLIRTQLKIRTPIIAMTAHALPGEREKCLDCGMTDHISKPINETKLFNLITKHLDLTKYPNNYE